MLRAPILGPILVKVNVARFARTFGSLMASGISVLDALGSTKSALRQLGLSRRANNRGPKVKNEPSHERADRASKHFPAIVGQMLAVGEETGKIDEILIKLAGFYERRGRHRYLGITLLSSQS